MKETEKEAIRLVERFENVLQYHEHDNYEGFISSSDIQKISKEMALICVDELLEQTNVEQYVKHWQQVKNEINKR